MRARRLVSAVLSLAALSVVALTACTQTVAMKPAKDANNPLCAEITVRLPEALAGQDRRWTDAQATGAWGAPDTTVLLACGVEVPGPTSALSCRTFDGIDWLLDPADDPWIRLTTYGRDPAVQLYIDTEKVSGDQVLASRGIVSAIQLIPQTSRCVAPEGTAEPSEGVKTP